MAIAQIDDVSRGSRLQTPGSGGVQRLFKTFVNWTSIMETLREKMSVDRQTQEYKGVRTSKNSY